MCILIIFCSIHHRMRIVSGKSCREKTRILCSFTFFRNLTIFELMWKNFLELDMPQITIWHMCIACWIRKATNTHSEYVILIAFLVHHWLHKCISELCCAYTACLVRVCYMIYIFVSRLRCFYLLHLRLAHTHIVNLTFS